MSTSTGVIEVVSTKTETKAGKPLRSPLYSFKLDDGEWYGCGFDNPSVSKGDSITFDWTQGDFGKDVNVSSISRGAQTVNTGATAVKVSPDQRQTSIVYQSSRKDAINFLDLAIRAEALKLPKSNSFDTLLSLVDETTLDFARKAIAPDLSEETVVEVDIDE